MKSLGTIYVLLLVVVLAAAQNTQLQIYQSGNPSVSSTVLQVAPIGSTMVFACSVQSITAYPGAFGYTELHAMVNNVDVLICSGTASGSCVSNSQGAPFQARTITVNVPTGVGTTFTITNAIVTDSLSYYCKITAGGVLYTQASNTWTQLQVYALPLTPSCTFLGSSNSFLVGAKMPQLQCSANIGYPYGWLQVTLNSNNAVAGSPYFLSLASNNTVQLSNGTYSMTYLYNYLNGSSTTFTLAASNNNDYFTCFAFNSYAYSYLGQISWPSSPLTIQVQYPVQNISVTPSNSLTNFTGSAATGYTLNVFQNTYMSLSCGAQGSPSPSYSWTRVSGLNLITFSNQVAAGTLSVVETLTLQCNASNTISAATPSYATSQIVTVTVNIYPTPTTLPVTTTTLAPAPLNAGAVVGIVIGCLAGVVILILIIIYCVCGLPCKKHPSKSEKPLQAMTVTNSQAAPRSVMYEPEDKKQPLSMISEMDIPHGDVQYDNTARSRKPIVDPNAQSAAEYLDLNSDPNGDPNNGGYNQYSSQPTTPNGNMSGPPTYPGGTYDAQMDPNAYGNMNPYGVHMDGGYNTGTMA